LPIYARNKKHIKYGVGFAIAYNLRIGADDKSDSIFIGNGVIIDDYCHIE